MSVYLSMVIYVNCCMTLVTGVTETSFSMLLDYLIASSGRINASGGRRALSEREKLGILFDSESDDKACDDSNFSEPFLEKGDLMVDVTRIHQRTIAHAGALRTFSHNKTCDFKNCTE